jgi:hypothetical protein
MLWSYLILIRQSQLDRDISKVGDPDLSRILRRSYNRDNNWKLFLVFRRDVIEEVSDISSLVSQSPVVHQKCRMNEICCTPFTGLSNSREYLTLPTCILQNYDCFRNRTEWRFWKYANVAGFAMPISSHNDDISVRYRENRNRPIRATEPYCRNLIWYSRKWLVHERID